MEPSRRLTVNQGVTALFPPQGRFTIAAKHHITIAEIYETELVDIEKEKARLTKELGKKQGELKGLDGKLSNPGFLAKAPADVVAAEKERAEKLKALIAKLEEQLANM